MPDERLLVRDLMSRDIVAIEPDATVAEAIARMDQHRIHELPVMTNSTLKGWVSYDTLIRRAHAPPQSKLTNVMTIPPRISKDADVVAAADLFIRQNVRALPVVDAKGNLVGILSRTDVMSAAVKIPAIGALLLERVMTRDLETILETASVDEAARRLRDLNIRNLLVLNEKGKLVGTVGREVVLHALTGEDRDRSSVRGKAGGTGQGGRSKDRALEVKGLVEAPLTLPPTANLEEAVAAMRRLQKNTVVILDEGFPVGVVARANIIERLAARAVPDGPLVQIVGLSEHADSSTLDQIHAIARLTLKKVEREFRLEFLSLHYKVYKAKSEGDSKFSVTAHLSTEQKFIVAKADDWDPLRATHAVLAELERRAFEAKELRLERRKTPARRGASFYSAA